jgi:hypothetical protein
MRTLGPGYRRRQEDQAGVSGAVALLPCWLANYRSTSIQLPSGAFFTRM